ncbi:hypothetical protein FKM82_020238 [Ascaphus truei]
MPDLELQLLFVNRVLIALSTILCISGVAFRLSAARRPMISAASVFPTTGSMDSLSELDSSDSEMGAWDWTSFRSATMSAGGTPRLVLVADKCRPPGLISLTPLLADRTPHTRRQGPGYHNSPWILFAL